MTPQLEFWFEFGSNYSYLTVMRIEALAKSKGVDLVWKPFLLGPIFNGFGWNTSPFVLQSEKGAYVWKDMERQSQKFGLAFKRPTAFPRAAILPMRVALIGAEMHWGPAFCREVMKQNFERDMDIDNRDAVALALQKAGASVEPTLAAAVSDENKLRLRRNTEQAKARGVFGAPTFFVGEEMYWGNDRLEDALEDASLKATAHRR